LPLALLVGFIGTEKETGMLSILSPYKAYLYAAVGVIFLGLSVSLYVEHLRLKAANAEVSKVRTELSVSNASVTSLSNELEKLNTQLQDNAAAEKQKQDEIHQRLLEIKKQQAGLDKLESQLKNRQPTTNVPIPKDLQNAWNNL
jgi:peptidoglycan hydrolase CwlO-like protein